MTEKIRELEQLLIKSQARPLGEAEWRRFCELLSTSEACRNYWCRNRMDEIVIPEVLAEVLSANALFPEKKSLEDRAAAREFSDMLFDGPANDGSETFLQAFPAQVRAIGKSLLRRRVPLGAALLLLVLGACLFLLPNIGKNGPGTFSPGDDASAGTEIVGQVMRLNHPRLKSSANDLFKDRNVVQGERIELESGSLEFFFKIGVHLVLEGPAEISIIDSKRIRVDHGKFSARVDLNGTGFTVETPSGVIVDQGTEFGVDVGDQGETKVVVYRGNVDVYHQSDSKNPALFAMNMPPVSLNMGEGLLFRQHGEPEPIAMIESDYFLTAALSRPPKSPRSRSVITSVRDNIRDGSKKFYEIVPQGFGEDVCAYVDRLHEWNGVTSDGLPGFLIGGDMVRTFNADKSIDDFEMTVTVSAPSRFFVLWDKRSGVPDWLTRDFTKTEDIVGLDEATFPERYEARYNRIGLKTPEERVPANLLSLDKSDTGPGKSIDFIFDVWERKSTEPGEIVLGGLPGLEREKRDRQSFYGIVAVPVPE